jgi:hypothetical protein
MDTFVDVASQYVLPATAATIGAMYLDAKHHIVKDINEWRGKRKMGNVISEAAQMMGDYCTLYHALELNDPKAEGFWFEQRSWTFADIRREADKLAQWFMDQGVRTKGLLRQLHPLTLDFVAVYMTNSAEAYFTAMALSKLGVTNAMINSSLRGLFSRKHF